MILTTALVDKIQHATAAAAMAPKGHIDQEAASNNGLALFGTIGEVWLLHPDGSLWRVDSDFGLPLEPLPEELHTIAIVAGVQRYPWLAELLPPRPAGAIACTECAGTGKVGPGSCYFCRRCSGLGWITTAV